MPIETRLLKLYLGGDLRWHGRPAYRWIVERARETGLSGASVFQAELGFGASQRIHDITNEYSSYETAVEIEIIDVPDAIESFLAKLGTWPDGVVASVELATVLQEGADSRNQDSESAAGRRGNDLGTPSALHSAGVLSMPGVSEARKLTMYIGSSDQWRGRNLALAIIERCRAEGMAGASASRGLLGFGKHSTIHRAHLLGISDDLPERIEIIDTRERIAAILPMLREMMNGGLVLIQDVQILVDLPNRHGAV